MKSSLNRPVGACLLLFCAIFSWAPLTSSAAPITVPTDLNVGDKYRLAFVTSTTRDATSSNIADYNAFVTGVAAGAPELAALGTTWMAIGSTSLVNARDNTGTNFFNAVGVPIYRLDDTRVAAANQYLWDGALDAPIAVDEHGNLASVRVWTGTQPNGLVLIALGLQITTVGLSDQTGFAWVNSTSDLTFLGDTRSLYALSAELTVVPEPGSVSLVWIGATAQAGWQLHRRRNRIRQ